GRGGTGLAGRAGGGRAPSVVCTALGPHRQAAPPARGRRHDRGPVLDRPVRCPAGAEEPGAHRDECACLRRADVKHPQVLETPLRYRRRFTPRGFVHPAGLRAWTENNHSPTTPALLCPAAAAPALAAGGPVDPDATETRSPSRLTPEPDHTGQRNRTAGIAIGPAGPCTDPCPAP